MPEVIKVTSQDTTVIKGTSQDASVSYLVGNELVPWRWGVMTAKTKEVETVSETIHLACIRSALLTAEHYVKKQNRPMAQWWFDRADYETERLAKYRGVTLS
jgi:hypothetical protein